MAKNNELFNGLLNMDDEPIRFVAPKYDGEKLPSDFIADEWRPTPILSAEINTEAEWITQIRDFCREQEICPTTLITAYKELAGRDK